MSELYYKSKSSPCLFSLPALNIGPRAMHRQPQASGRKNILSSNPPPPSQQPPSPISREDLLRASLCTSQEFSPAICFISWPHSPKRLNFALLGNFSNFRIASLCPPPPAPLSAIFSKKLKYQKLIPKISAFFLYVVVHQSISKDVQATTFWEFHSDRHHITSSGW